MTANLEAIIKKAMISHLFIDIPKEEIGSEDGLQSVLGLDSLDFVELRVQCEKLFNVHISDEDFTSENFRTVRAIATLIHDIQSTTAAHRES